MKVCHLSSVHPRNDIRIFLKECISLKQSGYDVHYVVADGKGDEINCGINIHDIGRFNGRLFRILFSSIKIVFKGFSLKADVYHFHDPELAPLCLWYTLFGKKVIFDVHENVSEQILDKPWLGKFQKLFLSKVFFLLNKLFAKSFYTIIAEESYANIYKKMTLKSELTVVLNYPRLDFFEAYRNSNRTGNEFFYIGGVTNNRGLDTILKALDILNKRGVDFKMHFVGSVSDNPNMENFPNLKNKVRFYGKMNLEDGYEISKQCIAGLAILKPIGNYIKSYPTKVFEYMAVGLPVLVSNFSLYKGIVEDDGVGWCVDPTSPKEIANQFEAILKSDLLNKMSQTAVERSSKYSWKNEEEKLLKLYHTILQ